MHRIWLVLFVAAIEAVACYKVAAQPLAETCQLPPATTDMKVVVAHAAGALALSNVAIDSQDATTHAARITIEPGSEPLYLVLISGVRLLWKFDGAIGRVKRVVLASVEGSGGKTMALATEGLPAEVVTFGAAGNCATFWANMYGDSKRMAELMQRISGRRPDVIKALEHIWMLKLPSGVTVQPPGFDQREIRFTSLGPMNLKRLREDMEFFYPGGVVRIDPKKVVASLPVEPYNVLPNQAGLLQLMQQGALEPGKPEELVIRKPIRFPAGLFGAHSVRFVLGKGVPDPTGDSGHSSVISEETGKLLCFSTVCWQRR
jgi:hypothetical protein